MAVNRTRLSDNRSNLGEKVPLKQPYVLLVDPSNLCNLKCRFCPSGNLTLIKESNRVQTIMDFEVFQKIIDDLQEFDENIKVLRMYKEGEPLVNPNFSKMVRYAKDSGKIDRIDTTTNGILFETKRNQKIIESGIDQINISINGVNDEQISHYTRTAVNFKEYVRNIKDLYENRNNCEIYIKSIKENLSSEEQKKFYDIFGPISDRIFLERISPAWPDFNFEGMEMNFAEGNYGQKIEDRMVCPYLFYIMVVNSDGTVSTCVGDWEHKQILGDVNNSSVKDIWNGKIMHEYWENHLTGNKNKYYMCEKCEVIRYGSFDNIDEYSEQILQRLNDKNYS